MRPHTALRQAAAVTAAVGLLMAAGLTGCSGSEPEKAAAATRTVHDANGASVSVPSRPQRVVTLSEPTLDGMLALGIRPVGTTAGRGQKGASAYLADQAKGIPIVATVAGPNLEKVNKLHPDLILTDATVKGDAIGQLKKIAPVVLTAQRGEDWRDAFRNGAAAVNRAQRAGTVLDALDKKIGTVRDRLGSSAGDTVSVVRWAGGAPAVIMNDGVVADVLTKLGLHRPPAQRKKGPGHSVPVSAELLSTIDADWIIFGALAGHEGGQQAESTVGAQYSKKALSAAEKTPGWKRLGAYRAHHVVPVDGSSWTSAGGVLAARAILSDVDAALTGHGS